MPRIEVDTVAGVLKCGGVAFSVELLELLSAPENIGSAFRVVGNADGVVTLQRLSRAPQNAGGNA